MNQRIVTIFLSLVFISLNFFSFNRVEPIIVFMDVGQGDGIVLNVKDIQVVIDGGPGEEFVSKIGRYINNFDRDIEYVVISHWHSDHFFGLIEIFSQFNVKTVVMPTIPCFEGEEIRFLKEIIKREGSIVVERISIDYYGVKIEVFSNFGNVCSKSSKEINNASLVTYIEYKKFKGLLMGDIEKEMEKRYGLDVDLLKAGHHCSETSTQGDFLKALTPKIAICSYGRNFYGHPSIEVIERLKKFKVDIYHTYLIGDIIVNLKSGLIYNQDNKLLGKL